ncbi:MAG: hypothetical protein L0312_18890 [Acidobacteria bacterium]|nr:hypothetical protein [Acidobacteriota bacterium]
MKKHVLSRLTLVVCFLSIVTMLVTWMPAQPATGQEGQQEGQEALAQSDLELRSLKSLLRGPNISIRPVIAVSNGSVVPGTGTILVRTRDDVFATMHTSGLTSGTAVTFWWGFFNNPRHCATRPCTAADFANPAVQGSVVNAGGKIIGADGTATFGAFRDVGDTTGVAPGIGVGLGLLNPLRAEIHLVTRTHGPAMLDDQQVLSQQLSMFNGGCPPNTCANQQASIHQP